MGQPVYGRITPDGYPDRGDEWLSNNDLLARFNFAAALSANKIQGTKVDLSKLSSGSGLNDPPAVAAALSNIVLMGQVSAQVKAGLDRAANRAFERKNTPSPAFEMTKAGDVKPNSPDKSLMPGDSKFGGDYVAELLALTLGSPDFQKR
jgi:hypothetical protein